MWSIKYSAEARDELLRLDKEVQLQVLTGIKKVSANPLPHPNGYGKPLGNRRGKNLTGFFKIKYKGIGIRAVYSLASGESVMNILVISKRDDDYCYLLAAKLYDKYGDGVFEDKFLGTE